jgi:hypothetical protein
VFDQEQRHGLATHMYCLSPANLGRTNDQTDLTLTWEVVRNRHVLLGQFAELIDTEIAVESDDQAESPTLPATAPQQHCQADEVADVPRERRWRHRWPDLSESRAEVVRDWEAVANMRVKREDPQESVPGPGGWRPRRMHVVDKVRERVVQRGDRENLETVVQDVAAPRTRGGEKRRSDGERIGRRREWLA